MENSIFSKSVTELLQNNSSKPINFTPDKTLQTPDTFSDKEIDDYIRKVNAK